MKITDVLRSVLDLLNRVDIRGESGIAAMSEAIALLKGLTRAISEAQEDKA